MDPFSDTNPRGLLRRIKQHVKAKEHRFFAVIHPGFEDTARDELTELGLGKNMSIEQGGIEFSARIDDCYRANLCSRTITRIIMRIARFRASTFIKLLDHASRLPWELYLNGTDPIDFSVSCHKSRLYHSGAVEERLKKAVTHRLSRFGIDPTFSGEGLHQTVYARLDHDACQISLDSSGDPLYKRGYKSIITRAPMRETLAACILRAAGAVLYDSIIDPMCGSGTFSIEAAMMLLNRPPGMERSFAFELWPVFSRPAYSHLAGEISGKVHPVDSIYGRIHCYDKNPRAVKSATANIKASGLASAVVPCVGDFFDKERTVPPGGKSLIVVNPPYGTRLGDKKGAAALYRNLGTVIKQRYKNCGYAVVVPGLNLEKVVGLPWDRKILFTNGGIKVALLVKDR